MSIDEIERTIPLRSDQFFCHSQFIRAEINSFDEAFVRNERFKEFEGLLRTNHRIYESLETKLDLQRIGNLRTLTKRVKNVTDLLENIGETHFTKDSLDAMDLMEKPMSEIVQLAELKQREIEEGRRKGESDPKRKQPKDWTLHKK